MALAAVCSRVSFHLARAPAAVSVIAARHAGTFEDREKGEETAYFRRAEREQLEKLLNKMKTVEDSSKTELLKILGPHKLPEEVLQALLAWKGHF